VLLALSTKGEIIQHLALIPLKIKVHVIMTKTKNRSIALKVRRRVGHFSDSAVK